MDGDRLTWDNYIRLFSGAREILVYPLSYCPAYEAVVVIHVYIHISTSDNARINLNMQSFSA